MNNNLINKNLPKFFTVSITYIDGTTEEFKCASRIYDTNLVEFLTTDNTLVQVIINNIKTIKYDKNYTKMIEEARVQTNKQKKVAAK